MRKTICLGDMATYINGYAFKPADWGTKGLPIIRIQNLTDSGKDYNYYEGEVKEKYLVRKGDVLISWSASIGVYEWEKEDAWLNQHIFKVVFDKGEVDKRYFKYATGYVLEKSLQYAHGSTMKHLTKGAFDKLPIPIYDLKEQRVIAEKIGKVDEAIFECEAMLADFELLVKSRFIEMFGSPITNDKNLPIASLGSCLQGIENGKSFVCDSNSRTGKQPGVLKLSAATYGIYKPEENKAILSADDFVEQAEVHAGDLLFTRKNTPELVGMSAYVWQTPEKLMMPDLIFRLIPNQQMHPIFLWKLINHDVFRCKIQELATGTAKSMSNISKERLRNLEIIVPPIKLQNQFADFVVQTDKSELTIQKSMDNLQELRDSLLQDYFG